MYYAIKKTEWENLNYNLTENVGYIDYTEAFAAARNYNIWFKDEYIVVNKNDFDINYSERLKNLYAIHETMRSMNDEDCYYEYLLDSWIPDEPSEEDYEDLATSDNDYAEQVELFKSMLHKYGEYGVFIPTVETIYLLKDKGCKFHMENHLLIIDDYGYIE